MVNISDKKPRFKVAVVEDDRDINELITYNLRKEGFEVSQAFDGYQAKAMLKDGYFNIILLDLMLEGMSGFDICRELKENPLNYRTFIVIVSARTSAQDKLYAHILGADCYITKPFKMGELLGVVKEVESMSEKKFTVEKK